VPGKAVLVPGSVRSRDRQGAVFTKDEIISP